MGARFRRKTAVCTASPQKWLGTPHACRMLLAVATTVWFRRSTTPFCCGVYGAECWRCIPCPAQYSPNVTEVNSPPLSVRSTFNFFPVSRSTRAWKAMIAAGASAFVRRRVSHMKRLMSSTSSRKCSSLPVSMEKLVRRDHREPTRADLEHGTLLLVGTPRASASPGRSLHRPARHGR